LKEKCHFVCNKHRVRKLQRKGGEITMNKKLLISTLSLAVIGASILSVSQASAFQNGNGDYMMQKLAERFNLNPGEVETFFEEMRAEKQTQMQVEHENRLNQMVTDGKITEAQKQAIIQKHEEMRANFGDMADLTPEEQRANAIEKRQEMQTWAEQNGIDLQQLGPLGFERGRGIKGGFGMRDE
jgi:hypothetical protein